MSPVFRDTIYNLPVNEANSIYAGLTYCADNRYPVINEDYAYDVSDSRTEFTKFVNFDRDSSNFKEVCYSTCCWTLLVSPDIKSKK